jgi:hypothetical protein
MIEVFEVVKGLPASVHLFSELPHNCQPITSSVCAEDYRRVTMGLCNKVDLRLAHICIRSVALLLIRSLCRVWALWSVL